MKIILGFLILVSTVITFQCSSENNTHSRDDINKAIELMRSELYNADSFDWDFIETKVIEEFENTDKEKFEKSIFRLLELTKTNHSFFKSSNDNSSVIRNSDLKCNNNLNRNFDIDKNIGYIDLPAFPSSKISDSRLYVKKIRNSIKSQLELAKAGWIIDLRENTGGNMWPMLVALSPFFEDGILGYFDNSEGTLESWGVYKGSSFLNNQFLEKGYAEPFSLEKVRVAVLISNATASSGEAVLIAFKGRENVRVFGHDSCGLSSANRSFEINDRGTLNIVTGVMLDKRKKSYGKSVEVDVKTDEPVKQSKIWLLNK